MALNAYLRLKGQKHGDIKGSVTQKGREGKILVIAAEHGIASPRDAASGLANGKRQHRPFFITKELDASSPLLYAMLVANEAITEWELQFWTPQIKAGAGAGTELQHYTVKLTDARIVSIDFHMPNNRDPALAKLVEYEQVGFSYRRIDWTWVLGGITAQDDWGAPVTALRKAAARAAPKAAAKAGKTATSRPSSG